MCLLRYNNKFILLIWVCNENNIVKTHVISSLVLFVRNTYLNSSFYYFKQVILEQHCGCYAHALISAMYVRS